MSQNLSTGAIVGITAAGLGVLYLFATRSRRSNSNNDSSEYDIGRQGGTRRNRKQNKSRRK